MDLCNKTQVPKYASIQEDGQKGSGELRLPSTFVAARWPAGLGARLAGIHALVVGKVVWLVGQWLGWSMREAPRHRKIVPRDSRHLFLQSETVFLNVILSRLNRHSDCIVVGQGRRKCPVLWHPTVQRAGEHLGIFNGDRRQNAEAQ